MPIGRRGLLLAILAICPISAQNTAKRVIVLLGPPGAGKTTQAERLKGSLGLPVISMADIIRKEGGGNKGYTRALGRHISGDDLVNDDLANALIRKRVSQKNMQKGFIVDGYPVTAKQAEYFDAMLTDLDFPAAVIVHLSLPDAEADKRLTSRGKDYDTPENIQRRLAEYRAQADVLVGRYGAAIRTVDGTQSADSVAAAIRKALGY